MEPVKAIEAGRFRDLSVKFGWGKTSGHACGDAPLYGSKNMKLSRECGNVINR